jgi:hypothetical protein
MKIVFIFTSGLIYTRLTIDTLQKNMADNQQARSHSPPATRPANRKQPAATSRIETSTSEVRIIAT